MLDTDLDDYLTEYRLQAPTEPIAHYDDGELEAQWLVSAGFPHLTKAFEEGRELTTAELSASIAGLPRSHAEAVKQRVKTLNRTVAGRTGRNRHSRKPDIRDVFRHDADASSTGTRSRSATPDSLDSISGIGIEHQHHQHHWPNHHHHPHHHDDHHAATAAVASSVAIDGGDGTAMVGDANVERALNGCNNPEADVGHGGHQIPSFVSIFEPVASSSPPPPQRQTGAGLSSRKQNLRRTPSAPLRGSADLFRGSHIRCDIPFYSAEGIELLGFQRLGTIHIPRVRSGSDPSCSVGHAAGVQIVAAAHSHSNLTTNAGNGNGSSTAARPPSACMLSSTGSSSVASTPDDSPAHSPMRQSLLSSASSGHEPVSFENMMSRASATSASSAGGNDTVDSAADAAAAADCWQWMREPCCDIATLPEADLKRLQPLLWLELATLFDRHHVSLDKRKPYKRKRKEEGHVFGVSLNALIRRDQQVTGEDSSLVPLVLQGLLDELMLRGVREEGILRVPGNKQKIEAFHGELEQTFYARHECVGGILERAGVHDLSALLKRWLRELPLPLLASDLIHLFFQAHEIPPPDQYKAVSILCQLLPHENRNTLRAFLQFLKNVIDLQALNKMSQHNVATIMAPSLFPPRFIYPVDKNDVCAQVRMAAQCCRLTDIMISQCDSMWLVPQRLIDQARRSIGAGAAGRRQTARKTLSMSPIVCKVMASSVGSSSSGCEEDSSRSSSTIVVAAKAATAVAPRLFHAKHVHKIVI